jgi:predicted secreted protein
MERARKVAVVAHCFMNVNTKVKGLARFAGAHPLVSELIAEGQGIVQLPCPEVTYLGMRRWGMAKEQYDTPAYRRHCRSLVEPVVETLAALVDDGCVITGIWGMDGSPSCGATATCAGYEGGELESMAERPVSRHVPGEGVLFAVLQECLAEAGLDAPFRAVPEQG